MEYPKPDATRSGCKVSFNYYRDSETAKQASIVATREGERLEDNGYDFGFRSPGAMRIIKDGELSGMTEVVIP